VHMWKSDDVVIYDNRSVVDRGRRFDGRERRETRHVATIDDARALEVLTFDRFPNSIRMKVSSMTSLD
jgi:alpha-ketoglutarate-dependent taurine dioxygenase